jgi:transposase
MEHVAIDLGGKESQICVRREDGAIRLETRCRTIDLPKFFEDTAPSRVILETCAESFHVAESARASGHDVRVVAATLVRALGVGSRRIKTDKRDAQILSEVSTRIDLKGVHLPTSQSRENKSICRARTSLVRARTKLINATRGWMRAWGIRVRSGEPETLPERLRATLQPVPQHAEALLKCIESLTTQIDELDKTIARRAKTNDVCKRLMTVPGVGPVTSLLFVATLDDVRRFPSAAKVGAYLGLTPGENSSSGRVMRTGITKAGSTEMRALLVQGALSMKRCRREHPLVQWAMKIEQRRGRHIATVALARKLAGIMFALWRDETTYSPSMTASAIPVSEAK